MAEKRCSRRFQLGAYYDRPYLPVGRQQLRCSAALNLPPGVKPAFNLSSKSLTLQMKIMRKLYIPYTRFARKHLTVQCAASGQYDMRQRRLMLGTPTPYTYARCGRCALQANWPKTLRAQLANLAVQGGLALKIQLPRKNHFKSITYD